MKKIDRVHNTVKTLVTPYFIAVPETLSRILTMKYYENVSLIIKGGLNINMGVGWVER